MGPVGAVLGTEIHHHERTVALDGIGHTSGWDALAGLMACVEARLDAFECTPETTK